MENFTRPTPPICSTIVSLGAGEGVRRCEGECWDMKLVRSTVDKNVLPIASSLKYSSISTSTSSLSKGPSRGLGRKSTELQSNAFLEPLYSASFVFSIKKKRFSIDENEQHNVRWQSGNTKVIFFIYI